MQEEGVGRGKGPGVHSKSEVKKAGRLHNGGLRRVSLEKVFPSLLVAVQQDSIP